MTDMNTALQLRLAELQLKTARLNNKNTNRIQEGAYGASYEIIFEGPIKILSIGEEIETKPAKGFEDLQTMARTISFIPLLEEAKSAWKKTIFKSSAEILYEKLENYAEKIDEVTGEMEPAEWNGEVSVLNVHTDIDFTITNTNGRVTKANKFTVILFKGDSIQTEIRRELRRRTSQFLGNDIPLPSPAEPDPSTNAEK
jgi:hypothetical protein